MSKLSRGRILPITRNQLQESMAAADAKVAKAEKRLRDHDAKKPTNTSNFRALNEFNAKLRAGAGAIDRSPPLTRVEISSR